MNALATRRMFVAAFWIIIGAAVPQTSWSLEVITMRSGFNESLSIPLSVNVMDTNITALTGGAAAELMIVPFTEANAFSLARTSSVTARAVNPHPNWALTQLAASPEGNEHARWVNPGPGVSSTLGVPPQSALYAMKFTITSTSIPGATLKFNWLADDGLGDPAGTNPIGVYLNGVALPASFAGGSIFGESSATTSVGTGYGLQTGDNWLYVYQRDTAQVVSGVIFAATIRIVPEPSSALLAILAGAALVRVRRRNRMLQRHSPAILAGN